MILKKGEFLVLFFEKVVRQKEFLEKTVVTLKSQLHQVKLHTSDTNIKQTMYMAIYCGYGTLTSTMKVKTENEFHFCNVF